MHNMKYPNYKDLVSSLLQFDMIRLQKLLHVSQNAVITAVFCFFVGVKINGLFDKTEEETLTKVVLLGCLQMVVIILSVYYVRKLTKFIPFLLRITDSYDPFHKSVDGEGLVGSAIAMSLLLMSTQSNMRDRIKKLIGEMSGDKKEVELHNQLGDTGDMDMDTNN